MGFCVTRGRAWPFEPSVPSRFVERGPKQTAKLTNVPIEGVTRQTCNEAQAELRQTVGAGKRRAKRRSFRGHAGEQMTRDERNVFGPVAELRHPHSESETFQKIAPQSALRAVGRGDQTKAR